MGCDTGELPQTRRKDAATDGPTPQWLLFYAAIVTRMTGLLTGLLYGADMMLVLLPYRLRISVLTHVEQVGNHATKLH